MKRTFLRSKLQEVVITGASVEYEGSITIDEDLMDAAGLLPYERVEVNGKTNPSRITTYVLPGVRGSGVIELNGGAAQHFEVGDKVHILCFTEYNFVKALDLTWSKDYEVTIVRTDKYNRLK